jgi:2-polyprenyl-6-methoxyphenol hydroxylase-like FAD-dependent oxidoreductase
MDTGANEATGGCMVVGGVPAGMLTCLLPVRQSVRVPERHADFLGDFRGGTIRHSTMRITDELGAEIEVLRGVCR